MSQCGLGPNGAQIAAADLMAVNIDKISSILDTYDVDYVLIDTPPLGSVADALTVAGYCDGSLLVVRSGDTPRKLIENSVQLLQRTETPMLGMVLNRADTGRKGNGYYYNHYYRYGYNDYGYGRSKK